MGIYNSILHTPILHTKTKTEMPRSNAASRLAREAGDVPTDSWSTTSPNYLIVEWVSRFPVEGDSPKEAAAAALNAYQDENFIRAGARTVCFG